MLREVNIGFLPCFTHQLAFIPSGLSIDTDIEITIKRWANHKEGLIKFDEDKNTIRGIEVRCMTKRNCFQETQMLVFPQLAGCSLLLPVLTHFHTYLLFSITM
jgi:hypothetical protein